MLAELLSAFLTPDLFSNVSEAYSALFRHPERTGKLTPQELSLTSEG